MAFEEDLGYDAPQPQNQDYTVSATGLISRTLSLLTSRFVQYIIIVGIIGAACTLLSFILLYTMLGLVGVIAADPIGYFISEFLLTPTPDMVLVGVLVGFAIFAFIINAIIGGAAIKFSLDDYGGTKGDIGASYSHSLRRFPAFIFVQLLISFLVAVVLTPSMILIDSAMEMIGTIDLYDPIFPPGSIELLTQGFLLLFVGGIILIYLQTRFAPTLAIVIDTDMSAIDSLKKSWELTSGNFMHIFGGMILLGLVTSVLNLIIDFILGGIFTPLVMALLFSALAYIYPVVLYRDLDSRKGISNLPGYVM